LELRPRSPAPNRKPKPPPRQQVTYSAPPVYGITIYDLDACTCRYPLGDGPPFLFCGLPCDEDCAYCFVHCRIAHRQEDL
jgi:hypothetical protein